MIYIHEKRIKKALNTIPYEVLIGKEIYEVVSKFDRDFILNNGEKAKFVGLDDWSRPIFRIKLKSGRFIPAVLLEENLDKPMYSVTDWDEPDCPLKEAYQICFLKRWQEYLLDAALEFGFIRENEIADAIEILNRFNSADDVFQGLHESSKNIEKMLANATQI